MPEPTNTLQQQLAREKAAREELERRLAQREQELMDLREELNRLKPQATPGGSVDATPDRTPAEVNRYRSLVENMAEGIVSIDPKGRVESMNPAAERLFERSAEEMIGQNVSLLMADPYHKMHDLALERYLQTGEGTVIGRSREVEGQKKSGGTFPLKLTVNEFWERGQRKFIGVLRDLSESKRSRERQLISAALLESSGDFIAMATLEGQGFFINSAGARMMGMASSADVTDTRMRDYIAPQHRQRFEQEIVPTVIERGYWQGEISFRHFQTGEIIETEMSLFLVREREEGEPICFATVTKDITERVEFQRTLQATSTRLATLIQSLNAGVLVENENRHIELVNQTFCDMFAIPAPPEVLVGTDCSNSAEEVKELFEESDEFVRRIGQILRERSAVYGEELKLRDGRVFRRDYVPIYVGEEYRGHLWQYADISEQHAWERTLRETSEKLSVAAAEAERANRAKSEFLANMSHEIRTPMTAIIGYTDMLKEADLAGEVTEELSRNIRRNADHLLSIINDILDLSKIEVGKFDIRPEPTDLFAVVEQVSSAMQVRAAEASLDFRVHYQGPMPENIQTDPIRLRQILFNLVSNAIKFTEEGSVELRLRCDLPEDEERHARVVIEVEDTGIGIAEEKLEEIFQPFSQVVSQGGLQREGTGLGLSISRRLASLMNAELHASSSPGRGSCFALTLDAGPANELNLVENWSVPVNDSRDHQRSGAGGGALHGIRVLVVEDGPDNRRILRFYLERAGMAVEEVVNGQEAVAAFEAGGQWDVILMDMMMPVMDGYQATRELRARGARLPIIALTAFAMLDDREKTLRAGCSDYVSKPIDPKHLLDVLERNMPANSDENPQQDTKSVNRSNAEEATTGDGITTSSLADDEDFAPLIELYMEDLADNRRTLADALQRGDRGTLTTTLHRLKGSAGSYGFQHLSELALACEHAMEKLPQEWGKMGGEAARDKADDALASDHGEGPVEDVGDLLALIDRILQRHTSR